MSRGHVTDIFVLLRLMGLCVDHEYNTHERSNGKIGCLPRLGQLLVRQLRQYQDKMESLQFSSLSIIIWELLSFCVLVVFSFYCWVLVLWVDMPKLIFTLFMNNWVESFRLLWIKVHLHTSLYEYIFPFCTPKNNGWVIW